MAKTTADLYKLMCVGGVVLCGEYSWLGLRSRTHSSACPRLNYNADKMPSQLKQSKPSNVSENTLHMGRAKENQCSILQSKCDLRHFTTKVTYCIFDKIYGVA